MELKRNLVTSESRSEVPGKFSNVMLERAPVKWAPELWACDSSPPDMANSQEKEVDPFDAGHVSAGSFVPIHLSEPF
jgi:hypothetical protein